MAKLYVEEEDALATAKYNSADVMLSFGTSPVAEETLPVTMGMVGAREAQEAQEAQEAPSLVETHVAGVNVEAVLRSSLERVLVSASSGEPAPKVRVPYGTKQVGRLRARHATGTQGRAARSCATATR